MLTGLKVEQFEDGGDRQFLMMVAATFTDPAVIPMRYPIPSGGHSLILFGHEEKFPIHEDNARHSQGCGNPNTGRDKPHLWDQAEGNENSPRFTSGADVNEFPS
jgi:hypothetical protein